MPLNPSTTTVYARSAFYPSLRFTLSLQSAFYTQSSFYPWSAVRSPQSSFYTDRFCTALLSLCSSILRLRSVRTHSVFLPAMILYNTEAGRIKQGILCCRKFIVIFGSSDLFIEQCLVLRLSVGSLSLASGHDGNTASFPY